MIKIDRLEKLDATIRVPGSKYLANRALFLAALARGQTRLSNLPDNDDINTVLHVFQAIGIGIEKNDAGTVIITGCGGEVPVPEEPLDVNESGTLFRFLCAFCCLCKGKVEITGSERICQRPIQDLLDALNQMGIETESNNGCAPVTIHGGTLSGGEISVSGKLSSQFLSALLLISPYAADALTIEVADELVSKSYVDLTIDMMDLFGVEVNKRAYTHFFIESGQQYESVDYPIPGDWSSANYFLAAAALLGGRIEVQSLDMDSVHGERRFVELLKIMGCSIEDKQSSVVVVGTPELRGVDVDMSNLPDSVQTLIPVAACATSPTYIRNIDHLQHKESDRIHDTITEMKKLGILLEKNEKGFVVQPSSLTNGTINSHNDHRLAMSCALVGLKVGGVSISDEQSVNKSFPTFWEMLEEIGATVQYE